VDLLADNTGRISITLHTLTEFVFLQLNDGSLKEEMNARAIVGPVRP
jgi:hypothetical protein